MIKQNKIVIGKADDFVYLRGDMANRHGLIAGATGTGKTVTLRVLAEGFSDMGVPVFLADIKGDLAGLCKRGSHSANVEERIQKLGLDDFYYTNYPVRFFDVLQKGGHPVRAMVSEMGPQLLARLMDLSDVQAGVLNIIFRIADDNGLLLIDLKDLRSMVQYVGEHRKEYIESYGNITTASIGAIQRAMLLLEDNGGDLFFGEPQLELEDWMDTDRDGRGYISILHCVELYQSPLLYSTFLLWLLNELFENLPEVGDLQKPKMVFFFDEAHLLFDDAPKALVQKIEQVVRLIRSKGVGVYFVTQNPMDLPNTIQAQLGNRIQHALRAYTPAEQKVVKAAAESFRENPNFKTKDALTELKTGEALVSCLDEEGRPEIVQRTTICPPQSSLDTLDDSRRRAEIQASDLYGKYDDEIDRQSAYEVLQEVREEEQKDLMKAKTPTTKKTTSSTKKSVTERAATNAITTFTRESTKDLANALMGKKSSKNKKSALEKATNSAISTIGGELGKQLSRGLFGILKK